MAAPVIQKAYIQDINRPIEVRHGGGLMFTGDANADRISVALYDCQTPFALSGSVTGTCIRNDGQTVVLTGGILGGNTAYVVLAQSCFVVPGPLAVTIRVSAGGVSTTVLKAVYTIDQTTTEEIVDPGHVVPDVSDIVAEYERMQAASDAAEAAAANANEAAQFATDDEWTNGDTLQTGRVYQTLHMANFEEETAGQYLRVISGNVAQAERVNQSGWSVYRYDLPHRMLIRLEAIDKNTPTVQGVLPMAAVLTSGSTETLYSLDSDRTGTYILADALLVNYSTTLNASAIKSVSITAVANRQFEDVIVCLDHAADFDKIVVFGDSIFANYINSTTVGNGVMAQFASLMGLPVVNNAVGGATLSTIQTSPKNVVQQVQDYIASATPGGTPLYIIDGGTNDQYNGGAGLSNLGQYTDGVNGITNTIYGATYRIINDLLGFGAQPWQIVITTPIPKGIRGDAAYTATMDAQLTAIAGAMAEIAMVQQINLINGYGSPFDNLTTDTAKAVIMPDDTHPSVYGAKLYAERIFRLLGVANQQEVASLKSAINDITDNEQIQFSDPSQKKYINTSGTSTDFTVSTASQTNYSYAIVDCSEGDQFTIFGSGGTGGRLWAFVKSNGDIIDPRAESVASGNNLVITAPADANKLVLNLVGNGAVYKNNLIKNRVGNLETEVATTKTELKSDINDFKDGFQNLNLFLDKDCVELLAELKYPSIINQRTLILENASSSNTYLMKVDIAKSYSFTSVRFCVFLESDKNTVTSTTVKTDVSVLNPSDFPANTEYIAFSFNFNTYPIATYKISEGNVPLSGYILPQWDRETNIRSLELFNKCSFNLLGNATLLAEHGYGYIDNNGYFNLHTSENLRCYLLPVDGKSTYYFTNCRMAVLLESDKATPIGSLIENVTAIDSTGASYIAFSFNQTTYPVADYVVSGEKQNNTEERIYSNGYGTVKGNMTDGTAFSLPKTNVKKNNVYSFMGHITTFSSALIGQGKNTNSGSWIEIDNTNITVHNYTESDSTVVFAHGLTIADYIYVQIIVGINKAKIIVYSNKNTYTIAEASWNGYGNGNYFAESVGSTLVDCVFTWSSADFRKSVWVFGDSYLGMTNNARWVYYLVEAGYVDNVLLNSFPGQASDTAIMALQNAINSYGIPKYIVWCLGMNDGADTNINTPSTAWKTGIDTVLSICKANGITPILATIPTVPTISHIGKCKWVEDSGYRYIDFAKAVGAESDGTWFADMLSGDGVHPTSYGAIALYRQAIADCPELTFSNP